MVILVDSVYAGVKYTGDASKCQSCPDDNMSFESDGDDGFKCTCDNGFTMVGDTLIGALVSLQILISQILMFYKVLFD
jgi:hypothetical protein